MPVLKHAIADGSLSHVLSPTSVSAKRSRPAARSFAATVRYIVADGDVCRGCLVHLCDKLVKEAVSLGRSHPVRRKMVHERATAKRKRSTCFEPGFNGTPCPRHDRVGMLDRSFSSPPPSHVHLLASCGSAEPTPPSEKKLPERGLALPFLPSDRFLVEREAVPTKVSFSWDRIERGTKAWWTKPPQRRNMARSDAQKREAPRMTCASHANLDVRRVGKGHEAAGRAEDVPVPAETTRCGVSQCLTADGCYWDRCRRRLRSTRRCKRMRSRCHVSKKSSRSMC